MKRTLLLLLLLACSKTPPARSPVPATLKLVLPREISGVVGDTIPLGAHLDRDGRTVSCAPVHWESLNPEVASVEPIGPTNAALVVHREGSSTIRATCEGLMQGLTGNFSPKKGQ